MTITESIEIIQTRMGYLNMPILETLEWMDSNWWLLDPEEQEAYKRFMRDASRMFAPAVDA